MKCALITTTVVLGIMALIGIVPIKKTIGDGGFDLTVTIRPSGKKAIASLLVTMTPDRTTAEATLAILLDPQFDWRSKRRLAQIEVGVYVITQDPYNGRPIVTLVPWTTHSHESLFGIVIREQNFFSCRALVVFAVMDDGERVGKAVEIPNPREAREVVVTLP